MVTKALVDRDIEAGRLVLQALDDTGVPVTAAFWLDEPDSETYRLYLATSVYGRQGPLDAYGEVQRALENAPKDQRPALADINVVSPKERTVVAIGKALGTAPGVSGIRFSRNTVDGVYIDDAWIYRLN